MPPAPQFPLKNFYIGFISGIIPEIKPGYLFIKEGFKDR
jgi:hypothetical protein